jgi:outer membrane protein assembly factor BamE
MKIFLTILALMLAGCSSTSMLPFKPHKIDIQQGNFVTQEMVAKLKPGMTRSQVRFALGTPLIVDPFRNDRWDYFYMMHKGGELTEQRVVTAIFRGDELLRIEGDVIVGSGVPAKPAAASVDAKPAAAPSAAEKK